MKPEELERSFARGQRILDLGAAPRELYIVRSGEVRLQGETGRAERLLVGGAIFGEISAILGVASPYRAVAEDATVVLVLDLPSINRLCRESQEFSMRLIRHLASEWSRTLDEGSPLLLDDIPSGLPRLVQVLLERHDSGGVAPQVPGDLADLAKASGLALLDAYRLLHELLDRGWVHLSEDQLSIAALDSLEALVR